jgi:hypothetical protein
VNDLERSHWLEIGRETIRKGLVGAEGIHPLDLMAKEGYTCYTWGVCYSECFYMGDCRYCWQCRVVHPVYCSEVDCSVLSSHSTLDSWISIAILMKYFCVVLRCWTRRGHGVLALFYAGSKRPNASICIYSYRVRSVEGRRMCSG